MDDDLVERLARAIHEQYLAAVSSGIFDGPTAAVPWVELGDDRRANNRAQARDIEAKLARIGCRIARGVDDFAFTESEVERLARDEHDRWVAQRAASGWTYGAVRDERIKRHPSMVRWEQLPEGERDKDRNAVRVIPTVLAAAGLRPRR
jgi:hypothetical protein